jgi:hypothetical protein
MAILRLRSRVPCVSHSGVRCGNRANHSRALSEKALKESKVYFGDAETHRV